MRIPAAYTLIIALAAAAAPRAGQPGNPFLGKWNLTGMGEYANYVYWLEIKDEGGRLSGMFLNRTSSPFKLAVVKIDNGELVFQAGQPGQPSGPEYRARFADGKLVGRHTERRGGRSADPAQPPAERVIDWIGVRPPAWPAANANGRHTYGPPVVLVDGTSLDAWRVQFPNQPIGWTVADGAITNQARGNNLISKAKFSDFRIEAEYKVAGKSNSGIYLRGRYELQVLDDDALTGDRREHGHMAIYGRTPPLVRASKPAGEWQTMDAIIVANRVTVVLNGQKVHDNAIIDGITGGALDNDEAAPGPILIQGDHSQVWVRKMVVTPIVKRGT